MTDEQIKKSLQKILDKLHDEKKGIFRHNSKLKNGIIKTQLALSRSIPIKDVPFNVSGKEIIEQKLGDIISCTGMTKAFLEAGKNSGLDLKAVITVNKELLDKGETNNDHTVPAVKMQDGQYHIIEPRCKYIDASNCRKLLSLPVKIGQQVFHILNSLKDQEYEVVAIIDQEELEKIKTLKDVENKNHRHNLFINIDKQR